MRWGGRGERRGRRRVENTSAATTTTMEHGYNGCDGYSRIFRGRGLCGWFVREVFSLCGETNLSQRRGDDHDDDEDHATLAKNATATTTTTMEHGYNGCDGFLGGGFVVCLLEVFFRRR